MAQLDLIDHYQGHDSDLDSRLQELHSAVEAGGEPKESHFHQIDLNAQSIRDIVDYPATISIGLVRFLEEIIKIEGSLDALKPLDQNELKSILESSDDVDVRVRTIMDRIAGAKYLQSMDLKDDMLEKPIQLVDFSPSFLINLKAPRPISTADLYDRSNGHQMIGNNEMSLVFTSMIGHYSSRHNEIYENGTRTPAYYLGSDKLEAKLKEQVTLVYQLVSNYDKQSGNSSLCLEDFRSLGSLLIEVEEGRMSFDDINRGINHGELPVHQMPTGLYDASNILNKLRKANLVTIFNDDRFFLK